MTNKELIDKLSRLSLDKEVKLETIDDHSAQFGGVVHEDIMDVTEGQKFILISELPPE